MQSKAASKQFIHFGCYPRNRLCKAVLVLLLSQQTQSQIPPPSDSHASRTTRSPYMVPATPPLAPSFGLTAKHDHMGDADMLPLLFALRTLAAPPGPRRFSSCLAMYSRRLSCSSSVKTNKSAPRLPNYPTAPSTQNASGEQLVCLHGLSRPAPRGKLLFLGTRS